MAHRSAHRAGPVRLAVFALTFVCASLSSSGSIDAEPRSDAAYAWQLPRGFPAPPVPADNPMSAAKVELGRHLFYERRLSGPGTVACASCHEQSRAFTDGRARAQGASGALHPRSAMSLANVAYNVRFGWAEPELRTLEAQVRVPLFNESPVEMGVTGREAEVLERLARTPLYADLFARAFPGEPAPFTIDNVSRALASFERTLIAGETAYDRLLFRDDADALSESARRGMTLFFSERLRCGRCHAGVNLSGPVARAGDPPPEPTYHNTALYDLGDGRYPAPNEGLFRASSQARDMGRFRAPTLRNIAVTAPYMHDGSLATLDAVIDHYAAGGRARGNRWKSEGLEGFTLASGERADLLAFLRSLTDEAFLRDPRFSNPHLAGTGGGAARRHSLLRSLRSLRAPLAVAGPGGGTARRHAVSLRAPLVGGSGRRDGP
jgi:cytochrome c peroxidase